MASLCTAMCGGVTPDSMCYEADTSVLPFRAQIHPDPSYRSDGGGKLSQIEG